jgi:hypothetical protein
MPAKNKSKDSDVKQAKKTEASSTQVYLKVAEIRDDTLVLKNGGIRAVLKVSSINFNLKSEDEQNAIIYSYQGFLNSLEFPIQVVMRSKKLDIDNYIDSLNNLAEKQTNNLLQRQTYEYMDYIQRLIEYADIMEKEFLVVIPYNPLRAVKPNIIQRFFQNLSPKDSFSDLQRRHKEFMQLKKGLNQRVNTVISGLENCGLKVDQLRTHDLIELFYEIYNPLTSRTQKVEKLEEMKIKTDKDILDEEKRNDLGVEEE